MRENNREVVMPKVQKSPRLAAIEALPNEMQDYALVDWATVAVLTGNEDVDYARRILTKAGVPLVEVSSRRKLPTWRELRKFIESRQRDPVTPIETPEDAARRGER
jgi:hypothetical protein